MNKRLFILMFLVLTSQAFNQNAYADEEIVNETRPSLTEVQESDNIVKTPLSTKVKNIFKMKKETQAKEAKALEPKEIQKPKKTKTKNKKNKNDKKSLNNQNNEIRPEIIGKGEQIATDIKPINETADNKNKALIDTAYEASIDTTRIISVENCVKFALENHPLIRMAMSNADIYKSRIAQAWANYFPTLSAGVSYSKNDMQLANFIIPTQKYSMYYVPNLSANMLLFDFGKTKAQADIAKRSYESATFSLQSSINDVVFNCKEAYFNLLFALQQEKVYKDTVKDYELHLQQAEAYYKIGTKPKIDVLTAKYNLGNAQLNLIKAQNTVKVAYVQLSNAMGMPEYSDYNVDDKLSTKSYNIDVEEAVKTAYDTRPELLAAKKKADASGLLVRASRRAYTPDITGFAGYTRGGKKMDTDYGYQIGAQIAYSSINLLAIKKQVDEAKATYKKDLADYENTRQKVYFEVKEAYINLVNAQDSIGVAKLSMDQAEEQYNQASGRYKVGLGDAIELKDAETTYRNSQLNYFSTLLQYHVSAANLERVMGVPLPSTDVDLL